MQTGFLYIIFAIFCLQINVNAQDWTDETSNKGKSDWSDKENSTSSKFFIGINAGGFFPNNNTAIIYTGASNITNYGIDYILSIPNYKTYFDAYFQHPYYVAELPLNPEYKTAFNIGLHTGINIGKGHAIFLDINTFNLNFEQSFTVAIEDPNNQSTEPTFEQIPIIGKEKRVNFNLGTQLVLMKKHKMNLYWSLFGNFNSTKLERNYILINGKEYEIIHSIPNQPNINPGGIGFGGGSGLGIKYQLTNKIWVDLTYNYYYLKTRMNDNIEFFGGHHGVMFRLIWN